MPIRPGSHRRLTARHGRWAAFGVVLSAHLAVFAELNPLSDPIPLETTPEPIIVSFVTSPQPRSEPTNASATIKRQPPTTVKPTVTKPKAPKNRRERTPSINKTPTRPIPAQYQNNYQSPDSSNKVAIPVAKDSPSIDSNSSNATPNRSATALSGNQSANFDAGYLHNPAPEYPAISRRLGEQGVVMLLVAVAADGTATDVAVKSSSGWSRLDQAALKCVKKWRFVPARRDGRAINASVIVPVRFSIEG